MKKLIIKHLEKPKIIIPAVFVVALLIGITSYGRIGQTPKVNFLKNLNQISTISKSVTDSTDLSFPKVGRLASLSVSVGSTVKKGDILATLDAGEALGTLKQAEASLELSKAQYASLDIQYSNAKKQQDVIVANAYRTLLSSNLIAVAQKDDRDSSTVPVDNDQMPQVKGTYTCDKEGSYQIYPYRSGTTNGYSFTFKGLEEGSGNVTYYTPQVIGSCGLSIQFPVKYYSSDIKWVIDIPNKVSSTYATNKNTYDLAVATREQVLKQFEANLGKNTSSEANTAQAAINLAQGQYEIAQASYKNNLIVSPIDGVITFIDSNLKIGQSISANKNIITVIKN